MAMNLLPGGNGDELGVGDGNGDELGWAGGNELLSAGGGNGDELATGGGKGDPLFGFVGGNGAPTLLFTGGGKGVPALFDIGGGKGLLFTELGVPIPGATFGWESFGCGVCSHTSVTFALQFGQIDSPKLISFPQFGQW